MTQQKPTLKLKLSGEALLKLQARIPKPKPLEPKRSEIFVGKGGKLSANNALKKAQAKREAEAKAKEEARLKTLEPKTEYEQFLEAPMNMYQYYKILNTLQKANYRAFPRKGNPPKPLAIGIHKDIAKIFKIPVKKAYYFCRIYCGTKSYKEACVKGAIRRTLKGKNAGLVD